MILLLTLLACESLATCEALPVGPVLSACAQDDALGPSFDLPALRLSYTGEVIDSGRGLPEASCLEGEHTLGDTLDDFATADARWFQVYDAEQDRSFTAVYYAPQLLAPILAGETATVYYQRETDSQGRPVGELLAYDGATRLRLYIGQAPKVSQLRLPSGVDMSEGEALCTARDSCDGRRSHLLEVSYQGDTLSLQQAQASTIGSGWAQSGGVETGLIDGNCGPDDRALVAFAE